MTTKIDEMIKMMGCSADAIKRAENQIASLLIYREKLKRGCVSSRLLRNNKDAIPYLISRCKDDIILWMEYIVEAKRLTS